MIVCAGRSELFEFAQAIGLGLVESAIGLTKLITTKNPSEIVFIGSAGSYGTLLPMEIVLSYEAANIEHSFVDGNSYSPLELFERSLVGTKGGHKTAIVNSSNYITTSLDAAKKLQEHGMDAENMEFYSVLRTAREFGIPAFGIFVITNYCGKNAHEEYMSNLVAAKKLLLDHCKNELKI